MEGCLRQAKPVWWERWKEKLAIHAKKKKKLDRGNRRYLIYQSSWIPEKEGSFEMEKIPGKFPF